jgi:hypothetical protein
VLEEIAEEKNVQKVIIFLIEHSCSLFTVTPIKRLQGNTIFPTGFSDGGSCRKDIIIVSFVLMKLI